MIVNILYVIGLIALLYIVARIYYRILIVRWESEDIFDFLQRLNVIPNDRVKKDKKDEHKFNNMLFVYFLVLAIPYVVILSFIDK